MIDRAITKYPYDPRRVEELMTEAGFRRDREGFFASEAGRAVPYDCLSLDYNSTPDRTARSRIVVQMMQLVSEDVPNYPIFRDLGVITHLASVNGPQGGVPETLTHWNIHEWEMS